MKRFAAILVLLGWVSASTPHLLCPITCRHAAAAAASRRCPHCPPGPASPSPAPTDDCDSPCCDGVDVVAVPAPDSLQAVSLHGAAPWPACGHVCLIDGFAAASQAGIEPSGGREVSDLFETLPRSGRALTILLGHLLF